MARFVVINEEGPAWASGAPMREEKGWEKHADFMNAIETERFVVFRGLLAGCHKRRATLVIEAPDEQVIRKRLAEDPWTRSGILRNVGYYSWEILLGKS